MTPSLDAALGSGVHFEHPHVLILGIAAAILLAGVALWRGPARLRVPATDAGVRWMRGPVDPSWLLSVALRSTALVCIAAALARPAGVVPENPAGGDGIDMMIALDASGSMEALDGSLDGRKVTRLELARSVVSGFIRERSGDRIGLVVFGEHAFTQSPLTSDHRLVLDAISRVEVGVAGDATAIGEAIGLATRRLRVPGAPPDARRVLLLITDGRHNSGPLGPETGAEIARLAGVRIHAVGIGTSGRVPFPPNASGNPRFQEVDLDRDTLRAVASISGGGFFHAQQPEDLHDVAAAIDQLEPRPRAPETRMRRASLTPFALAAALLVLLSEAATAHGLLRRLP